MILVDICKKIHGDEPTIPLCVEWIQDDDILKLVVPTNKIKTLAFIEKQQQQKIININERRFSDDVKTIIKISLQDPLESISILLFCFDIIGVLGLIYIILIL